MGSDIADKFAHLAALAGMGKDEWRFWGYVDFSAPNSCWEWLGARHVTGYGAFTYQGRTHPAHRISWLFATGEVLASEQVLLHACDNPLCVNPSHLSVGTHAQNASDRVLRNRTYRPTTAFKLTPEQKKEARELYSNPSLGHTALTLAEAFNISHRHMQRILSA